MSTSIPDGSTVLHPAASSASCTAAQAIKMRHGVPLIVIPSTLAGHLPNPRCGLIKLWCTMSSLKRGDLRFLMPRTPLRPSLCLPSNRSWPCCRYNIFLSSDNLPRASDTDPRHDQKISLSALQKGRNLSVTNTRGLNPVARRALSGSSPIAS